jgi:hypothetical protein
MSEMGHTLYSRGGTEKGTFMRKQVCIALLLAFASLPLAAADKSAAVDQKTEDAIVKMEKQMWEAWKNKDTKPFEENIADDGVGIAMGDKTFATKPDILADIKKSDCDVRSYSFGENRAFGVDKDAVLLVYKADQDATCGGQKAPPSVVASSLWVKRGGKWKNFSHQETPTAPSMNQQAESH